MLLVAALLLSSHTVKTVSQNSLIAHYSSILRLFHSLNDHNVDTVHTAGYTSHVVYMKCISYNNNNDNKKNTNFNHIHSSYKLALYSC